MLFSLIFGAFVIYLLVGGIVILSSDLELRAVCRRTWSSRWLFSLALLIWPLFMMWLKLKWRLKQSV
jgi:hypothetical protein